MEIFQNKNLNIGLKALDAWLERVNPTSGTLRLKNWGSGDASTTVHYRFEGGGGGMSLNDFSPEVEKLGDWYYQEKRAPGITGRITGVADEVITLLAQHGIYPD
jgi:hypothetical protein